MEKYSSYKDSGVKLLGEIPSGWDVLALKHILKLKRVLVGQRSSQYDLLSLTLQGVIKRDMDNPQGKFPSSFDTYQEVAPGDFIFCNFDNEETPRAVGLSQYSGMITGAYDVLFRKNERLTDKYLIYYFLYIDDAKRFKPLYKGLRKTVPYDSFMSYKIPVPSLEEQNAMVAYLDAATAKIDEAIAQQQRMIKLLNERQRIIIEKAVTKGINVDVELIDSGVDYIGTIPSHWETRRLGVLGQFTKGGNISRDDLDDDGPEPAILYGDIYTKYFVKVTDIKNHISSKTASASVLAVRGDLLMTGSGETKEDIGKTVVLLAEKAFIGGDVIQFKQTKNDSRYLSYVLNSKYSQNYRYRMSKGEIVVHIYPYSLKDLRITLPPVPEQKQIADYLDTRLQAIDNLKQVVLQQIDILQERKQIIINDVVTGKVKVV